MQKRLFLSLVGVSSVFLVPALVFAAPKVPAPSNLDAVAVSHMEISLSWQDNSDNETGFIVERGTDGVNFSELANVEANIVVYSNSGLQSNTAYYYRVRAFKVRGQRIDYSAYSNVDSATTLMDPLQLPAAPSGLTATLGSSTGTSTPITLTWVDNADNETGFSVQRSMDGLNFGNIAFLGANATTFENLVANGFTYYYRVKAVNADGSSDYSNVAFVTVP